MAPKKSHPLASRIKRVMQADDEVGKIAQATPFLVGEGEGRGAEALRARPRPACGPPAPACTAQGGGSQCERRAPAAAERALELFLQRLCERTASVAQERGAKTVTPSHMCARWALRVPHAP